MPLAFPYRITRDHTTHSAYIHTEACARAGSNSELCGDMDEALQSAWDGQCCVRYCGHCRPEGQAGSCACDSARMASYEGEELPNMAYTVENINGREVGAFFRLDTSEAEWTISVAYEDAPRAFISPIAPAKVRELITAFQSALKNTT